jgi:hypothetical protein
VKLQRLNEWEIDEWMLEAEMDFRDSGTLEIQDPKNIAVEVNHIFLETMASESEPSSYLWFYKFNSILPQKQPLRSIVKVQEILEGAAMPRSQKGNAQENLMSVQPLQILK